MTVSPTALHLSRLCTLACTAAVLAACGGGGGGGAGSDGPAPAPAPAPPAGGGDTPSTPSNADTVGRARALSAMASLALDGVPESPPAAAALAAGNGRNYFVDSRNGNDTNDGLAESPGSGTRGPWRTLARLMSAPLGPGDSVQLACGSEWNETLRLPASGTAAQPLVVRLPAAGCTVRPVIDGSVTLPAGGWVQHQGMVYKTTVATPVLQLTSATSTAWIEAHHPNRGFKPAEPTSLYLTAAADSPVGTTFTTGSDLVLPTGATLGPGTRARIRLYAWTMQDLPVASFNGRQITLAQPMTYPLGAGWGYYLMGQRWMVDSTGEWFHDSSAGQLYAQMPPGGVPATPLRATVLATGIDLQSRNHVVVDGLAVRRVGLGANLRGSTGGMLRNLRMEDLALRGVDATDSHGVTVEHSAFSRVGTETISGWRHDFGPSHGLVVRNNVIRDSGVRMNGEEVQSLPVFSYAAIYGGPSSTVSGNTVINAGYIGIQVMGSSLVERNLVFGACSVLDDGGGIYTQTSSGTTIRGNTVVHSRGALPGKATTYTQAQGIYLDESISNALVEDNTVIDTDNGIQVHDSAHNIVRNNRLFGNRRAQIWLQETRNRDNAAGDLFDNQIVGNQVAPVSLGAVGLWIDTIMPSSAHFGRIEGNRYFDRASPVVVRESRAAGTRDFSFTQWQRSTDASLPAGRDAGGSSTSDTGYAAFSVAGANAVPNAALTNDSAGWSSWNQTSPQGQLIRETCPAGICLRYLSGGGPSLVSSPNFSVVKDQWYRLSVDIATDRSAQEVQIVLRRGGGGGNGYESLSIRDGAITASPAWRRYSFMFQANQTVNARDPVTGDLGARIDLSPIFSSGTVTMQLANLELVPVTLDSVAGLSSTLINVGASARSWDCPLAGAQAAGCGRFHRFADNQALAWPVSVPAFSAVIAYAQEPALRDSDGDGIADAQDDCAATPTGTEVNARGCALALR